MNILSENQSQENRLKSSATFWAFTLAGAIAMLWLAIYNGFPLLYWDSAGYIHDWTQHIRPIGYNIFIQLTSLGISLWFTVFAQALITCYLMMRTAIIVFGENSPPASIASFAILIAVVLLTTLSKYTSWLMPDIFTSWIFFAFVFFLMSPAWYDRVVAILVLFISFFSHLSHLPVVILMLAVLATANLFSAKIRELFTWDKLIRITTVCIVITVLICTVNYLRIGSFALSFQSSGNFKVSHMISWGVVQKVLKEECGLQDWRLCGYQKELEAQTGKRHDWFLWNKNSPLKYVGGWEDQREQNEIVHYAARHHLPEMMKFAVRDGYRQWIEVFSDKSSFLPSRDLVLQRGAGYNLYYLPVIKFYPGDTYRLDHSRQSQGTLSTHRIIPFVVSAGIGWTLSLVAIVVFVSKKRFLPLVLIASSVMFVTINGFVTGALAGVANRKQGKVAWLVLYTVLVSITWYLRNRQDTRSAKKK
jgi:hypothetical protein